MSVASPLTEDVATMRPVEARSNVRQSQEARDRFWQVVIASSFFLVVVGASLFLGAVMVMGTLNSGNGSNELTADGRTARIARSLHDGKLCHYIVFDNKTARVIEDRIGRCDEGKPKPKKETPATFSWGK